MLIPHQCVVLCPQPELEGEQKWQFPNSAPRPALKRLKRQRAARIKRAEVREELKTGKLTVAQVLDMRDDPVVGRMKISTLIETLPGYGKAKAERIMKELQIAESRRIRGIGERQREALLARLSK